jgi:hypothetical protein
MEPKASDLLILREELMNAYDRQELKDLAAKFDFPFDLKIASDALLTEAADMIKAVIRQGQLNRLLYQATIDRPERAGLAEIAAHLKEATNLTFELREKLRALLAPGSVPEDKVREFCDAARPRGVVLRKDFREAFEAAMGLASIPSGVGVAPEEKYSILPFVEQVAYFWEGGNTPSANQAAKALIEWSALAASMLGVSLADAVEIRKRARARRTVSRYLLIQFHPSGNKYRLEAHLWTEGEKEPVPITCDEKPRAAPELPAAVGPVIKKALDVDIHCAVEFLAPLDLLNEPFDTWMLQRKFAARLGALSPVVIRLYDRVVGEDPEERQRWKAKWEQWKAADRPDLHWIPDASTDAGRVYQRLIADGSPTCVALEFAPVPTQVPEAVLAALAAGAPVLLWIRDRDAKSPAIRKEIQDLLNTLQGTLSLPRLVQSYRTKEPPTAHPNDFTLFYDCPERLPPTPRRLGIATSKGDAT